jgi:hypothetical protein
MHGKTTIKILLYRFKRRVYTIADIVIGPFPEVSYVYWAQLIRKKHSHLMTETSPLSARLFENTTQWTMFKTTNFRALLVTVNVSPFCRGFETSFLPYEYEAMLVPQQT